MISFSKLKSDILGLGRYVAVAAVGLLSMASCADGTAINDSPASEKEGYITLTLRNSDLRTRAEEEGIATMNENNLQRALICLMPATASSDDDVPAFMQTVTLPTNTQREGTVQVKLTRTLVNTLFPAGTTMASAYVIANLPQSVTYTDSEGQSQTVSYTDASLQGKTLGELRRLVIKSNPDARDFSDRRGQTAFVMDGTSSEIKLEVNSNDIAKSTVTGNVPLTRSAAKITLSVKVSDSVTDDTGREWTPQYNTMTVYLSNGVKVSAVESSVAPEVWDRYYNTSSNATNENARGRSFTEQQGKDYPYVQTNPFYTYPNNWADNEEAMTYMTLSLQWRSGGNYRICYYMVPVVKDVSYIARNTSYNVNINLGILGSTNPENPFTVDASYKAVAWGKEDVGLNIDDFRYLVVDRTDYTMNNESMISIPFYSSHETVIKYDDDELNYYLFNTTSEGIEKEMTITNLQRNRSTTTLLPDSLDTSVKIYTDWIDNNVGTTGTRTLNFHHELYQWTARQWIPATNTYGTTVSFGPYDTEELASASLNNNNIGAYSLSTPLTAAYSKYRMKITIVHKDKLGKVDEARYSQTIYITQNPGMYISVDRTTYRNNDGTSPLYANVYINNQNTNATGSANWWGLSNSWDVSSTTSNANPNTYVVNVSQLDGNSGYIIGDPRMQYYLNDLATADVNNSYQAALTTATSNGAAASTDWCNSATALYDNTTNRTLKYYYPTIESQDDQYKMRVAPKFRIASSFGKCPTSYSRTNARRRMATYQEMGYAAGRWRLPTYGELLYIIQLSAAKKIPNLFNDGGHYWTAQGIYKVVYSGNTARLDAPDRYNNAVRTNAYVRGVYDEWYWEEYKNYTITPTVNNGYSTYAYRLGDVPRSVAPAEQ